MLDMAFQLLAFFIFTYNPSDLEGHMDLTLPAAGEAKAKQEKDVDPNKSTPDTELELPSEMTVVVKASPDGQGEIDKLIVQQRAGDTMIANPDELGRFLKKARQELTNQDDVKIQADSKLKYLHLMKVMDVCTDSGFRNVGFAPPPDLTTTTP